MEHLEKEAQLVQFDEVAHREAQRRTELAQAWEMSRAKQPATQRRSKTLPAVSRNRTTLTLLTNCLSQKWDRTIRNLPWSAILLLLIGQIILVWIMLRCLVPRHLLVLYWLTDGASCRIADQRAENLFLTTYYDPTFAGYHDYGHPHAPSIFSWLLRGEESSSVSVIRSWISDIMYYSFGSGFGETAYRPSLVPT